MPSPFSRGLQNADRAFEVFDEGEVLLGSVAMTTADTAIAVTHGLTGTPDFVLMMSSAAGAAVAEGLSWTADATTLTIAKVDTQAEAVISYIAGVLT